MAYVYDPNLDDEQNKQRQQDQGGVALSSATTLDAPGTSSGSPTRQPSRSGQYTNLQQYLNANQDQNFGQQVAGKVQNELDSADKSQSDLTHDFRDQVSKGTANYDEGLVNRAKTDAYGLSNDASQKQAFDRMRTGTYSGPKQLTDLGEGYLNTQKSLQNSNQATNLTGSEQGQRTLLDRYYNRPTYSGGEKNLDQFLVQGDQAGQQKFAKEREDAKNMQSNFSNLQNVLAGEADTAKNTSQQTAQHLNSDFLGENGYLNQLQQQYQQRAQQADKDIAAEQSQYGNMLASGQDPFGGLSGTTLYNVDPRQFVSRQAAPQVGETLSQSEAQNFGALNQLLNQNSPFDLSGAGNYDLSKAVNLDKTGLNSAIDQQKNSFNNLVHSGYIENLNPAIKNQINDIRRNSGILNTDLNYLYNPTAAASGQANDQAFKQIYDLINNQYGINRRIG